MRAYNPKSNCGKQSAKRVSGQFREFSGIFCTTTIMPAALRNVASARRLLSADDAKIMTLDDLFPHGATPRTAAAGRESKLPLDSTAHDYNMEETGY